MLDSFLVVERFYY